MLMVLGPNASFFGALDPSDTYCSGIATISMSMLVTIASLWLLLFLLKSRILRYCFEIEVITILVILTTVFFAIINSRFCNYCSCHHRYH